MLTGSEEGKLAGSEVVRSATSEHSAYKEGRRELRSKPMNGGEGNGDGCPVWLMTGNKMVVLASSNVEQVMRSATSGHSECKGGRKELRSKWRGGEDGFGKRRDGNGARWEGRLARLARPRLGTVATRVRAVTTADAQE